MINQEFIARELLLQMGIAPDNIMKKSKKLPFWKSLHEGTTNDFYSSIPPSSMDGPFPICADNFRPSAPSSLEIARKLARSQDHQDLMDAYLQTDRQTWTDAAIWIFFEHMMNDPENKKIMVDIAKKINAERLKDSSKCC